MSTIFEGILGMVATCTTLNIVTSIFNIERYSNKIYKALALPVQNFLSYLLPYYDGVEKDYPKYEMVIDKEPISSIIKQQSDPMNIFNTNIFALRVQQEEKQERVI